MKQYLVTNVSAWNEEIGRMAEITAELPGGRQVFVNCVDDSTDSDPVWRVTASSTREAEWGARPETLDAAETRAEAEASPYRELYHLAEDALNILRRGEIND